MTVEELERELEKTREERDQAVAHINECHDNCARVQRVEAALAQVQRERDALEAEIREDREIRQALCLDVEPLKAALGKLEKLDDLALWGKNTNYNISPDAILEITRPT